GMIARQRSPRVGITVSRATISLRIEAVAATAAEADAQIASTREEIHQRVGQYVFGEGEGVQLQDVVAQQLATLGHSLAVIEIGHAAAITDWMAALERPERFAGGMHFSTMPLARRSLRTLAAARTEPVTPPPRPVATGPSDA